jgi:hypothetical protein
MGPNLRAVCIVLAIAFAFGVGASVGYDRGRNAGRAEDAELRLGLAQAVRHLSIEKEAWDRESGGAIATTGPAGNARLCSAPSPTSSTDRSSIAAAPQR